MSVPEPNRSERLLSSHEELADTPTQPSDPVSRPPNWSRCSMGTS